MAHVIWSRAFAGRVLLGAVGLLAASATPAAAQYKQIEFQEYLVNDKDYHNKKVSLHARYMSDQATSNDPDYGDDFFKGNGITAKGWYRFTVQFRGETKQWLFPGMEKGGTGDVLFAEIQKLKKGDKFTLYGKVKRMGDSGMNTYVEGRNKSGGGKPAPSVLVVAAFKLGWIKTMDEYFQDLGDEEQAEDTLVMLQREGPGVLPMLIALAQGEKGSELARVNACRAVALFQNPGLNSKLEVLARNAKAPDKVRSAALLAMAKVRVEDATKLMVALLTAAKLDEWAPVGAAEMLAGGLLSPSQLKESCAAAWEKAGPEVATSCMRCGEQAREKKAFAQAERFLSYAVELDPASGKAYWKRGMVRSALADAKPEQAKLAAEDFAKAIELGIDDADLYMAHASVLLKSGDKAKAAEFAAKVLAAKPNDQAALELQAKALGKSLAMLNARMQKSHGLTVRVPAAWRDAPEYVDLKGGRLFVMNWQDMSSPVKRGERPPQLQFNAFAQDFHAGGGGGFGSSDPDPLQDVKNQLTGQGITELESAAMDFGVPGAFAAFAVGEKVLDGQSVKYYQAVVYVSGKRFFGIFITDPKTFERERATFVEVFLSFRWEPPAGS